MITKPTVLILGAGASVDYGFPTGRGLLLKICREVRHGGSVCQFLTDQMAMDPEPLEHFAVALEKSLAPSVDRFLEEKENRQYEEIGKLAIAATLIPYEAFDDLGVGEETRWYETLFHLMVQGGQFQGNKLSILTFNYDRSLEACFFQALKSFYGLDDMKTQERLSKIPIIHLYDSLGDRLIGDGFHRGYEPRLKVDWVKEAAQKIKILHEAESRQEFDRALNGLSLADEIIFLGFGFHPVNIERLRLQQAARSHHDYHNYSKIPPRWLACRYGMGDGEVARAKASLGNLPVEFTTRQEWDINKYLKNTDCLIPASVETIAQRKHDYSVTEEIKDVDVRFADGEPDPRRGERDEE